jgi:hypothetical protein
MSVLATGAISKSGITSRDLFQNMKFRPHDSVPALFARLLLAVLGTRCIQLFNGIVGLEQSLKAQANATAACLPENS